VRLEEERLLLHHTETVATTITVNSEADKSDQADKSTGPDPDGISLSTAL
jgi:hypothetical protein